MEAFDRVVCFDLFHTLITPVASGGASYEDVLVRLGAPRERIYPFVRENLMTSACSIEEMVALLFTQFGFHPMRHAEAFAEAVNGWKSDNDCAWISGAAELLKELRAVPGMALCLVSNATMPGWRAVDTRLSVGGRFHALHLSWEQGVAKPHPACWFVLLDRLEVEMGCISPDRCWMIGDNQTDDLDPPARMGWNTFLAAKDGSNLHLVRERILGIR